MRTLITALFLSLCSNSALAQLLPQGSISFSGDAVGARDLSAVQLVGNMMAIVSDESPTVQLLEKKTDTRYALTRSVELSQPDSGNLDLEALALDGETLYVLGSHSGLRKKLRKKHTRSESRQRLATVVFDDSRDKLFRFDIDAGSGAPTSAIEAVSLRQLLVNHPVLGHFTSVPGKENGVDIEGMAVVDGRLYLGFRGPVLRGDYLPVVSLAFADIDKCATEFDAHPDKCRLLYLKLGGRGIRSLHRVSGGFLVLGGPMVGRDLSYELYFWDGRDCIPDKGSSSCDLESLGKVPAADGGRPEGLAVLAEGRLSWHILMLYDGVDGGAPTVFQVNRP